MRAFTRVQKLTASAIILALYVVIMTVTQGFAFGMYQVRVATALYALAYGMPFLTVPLGLANCLSNMVLGGLGPFDIVGGCLAGLLTAGACALLGKRRAGVYWTALPVILIPGLLVAVWLSWLLHVPYWTMAFSLCVGQILPGILGAVLVRLLKQTT